MSTTRGVVSLGLMLALVIVLALVGGAYLYSQGKLAGLSGASPTDVMLLDTSAWQIYEDHQNGFSFKYPSAWHVYSIPQTSGQSDPLETVFFEVRTGNTFSGGMELIIHRKNIIIGMPKPLFIEPKHTFDPSGIPITVYSGQQKFATFMIGDKIISLSDAPGDHNFDSSFYTVLSTFHQL